MLKLKTNLIVYELKLYLSHSLPINVFNSTHLYLFYKHHTY